MKLRTRPTSGVNGIPKRRWQAAFTFAEVLAAMVFMAIVIPVAMRGVQIANRAGVAAQRKTLATQLANWQLEEWMGTTNWVNSTAGGTFDRTWLNTGQVPIPVKMWGDYRWRLLNQPWSESAGMRLLTVEVTYLVQNQEFTVRLSTVAQDPNQ